MPEMDDDAYDGFEQACKAAFDVGGNGNGNGRGSDNSDTPARGRGYPYASIHHIEDGDTWRGRHRSGALSIVAFDSASDNYPAGQWYRLVGIDTHETGGDNAEQAQEETQFVEDFVAEGREASDAEMPFRLVWGDAQGEIMGTYGRFLVDLVRRSDDRSLAQALLDEFGEDIRYQGTVKDQMVEFMQDDLPE